jgi:hypothetical protein
MTRRRRANGNQALTDLLWLRLRHLVIRYGDKTRSPLTDLEAALLTAMVEAPKFGVFFNQRQLARLLQSGDTTVSETVARLRDRELCVITAVPRKGHIPAATMRGKRALLRYASVRFSGTAWAFPHIAELSEFQRITRAYEKHVTAEAGAVFRRINSSEPRFSSVEPKQ